MKKAFVKLISALVMQALLLQIGAQSFAAFAAQFESVESVEGNSEQKRIYDLVVLVVDRRLEDDGDLMGMVNRYAEDLAENYQHTDVQFLFYDEEKDSVEGLARALEDFYWNGGGEHENVLQGVVMIGDVPLPVVNKNGNRFVSMLPYTDFVDPVYVFDDESGDFVLNATTGEAKAEAWHGIIAGESDDLKSFFERNHAYYEGEEEARDFDRSLFFGDLINEEKQLNDDGYKRYVEYTESAEDLVYNRFNKHWAKEVSGNVVEDLPLENENIVGGEWLESLSENDMFGNLPDLQSKSVIEQFLVPYVAIFSRYNSSLNDFADNTGRYSTDDIDSVPKLITMRDEYSKAYLRNVNDALEKAVDRVVTKISEPLPLLRSVELSGSFPGDEGFIVNVRDNQSGENFRSQLQNLNFHYFNEVDGKFYVNGIASENLMTAKLCSVFLGSTKEEYFEENEGGFNPKVAGGDYSILTRSLRSDDLNTGSIEITAGVNTKATREGFVIEGVPEYGVPAFFHSPLAGRSQQYRGAFERNFEEGDLIMEINGKALSADYTFDRAIEENYLNVSQVIEAINDDEVELLNRIEGNLAVLYPGADGASETEILDSNGEIFNSAVLRQGRVRSVVGYMDIRFVREGREQVMRLSFTVTADGPILFPTTEDPRGSDGRAPERTPIQVVVYPKAMEFPANFNWDLRSNGAIFNLNDNFRSGYGSRPYDPAAGCNANATRLNSDRCLARFAAMPVLEPAGSIMPLSDLSFPERVSGEIDEAVDLYDFPLAGQKLDDVDEYIMNACYGMPLPSYATARQGANGANNVDDSNGYGFVLDPLRQESGRDNLGVYVGREIDLDFYGRLLRSIGNYVGGPAADDLDYDGLSPKENIWLSYDAIDPSEIVLHSEADERVTLADFADFYGVMDGKDNDGDNVVDDLDEANPIYGLSSLPEISRKMLSREARFVIPFGAEGFPEEWKRFGRNIELVVRPNVVGSVPSLIRHNEPTNYTISQQAKLGVTKDLPIDDPRYVAFQSLAGEVEKVEYVNLFDEELRSFPRLQVALLQKANELAAMPGSERIFEEEGDYSREEISEEILTRYLAPVVSSPLDSPISGFDLVRAQTAKVAAALEWQNSSIDEKHHTVLRNDEESYEASYLMLEGDSDNVDFAFDRDVVEEDERFDPIASRIAASQNEEEIRSEMEEEDDFKFVWLDQFLDEIERFLDSFEDYEVNFEQSCGYNEYLDQLLNGESAREKKATGGVEIAVAENVVARDGEEIVVETSLFDEDGEVLRASGDTFDLEINQNGDQVRSASGTQSVSPTGRLRFSLVSGGEPGVATVSVVSSNGVRSNALQVEVSGKSVSVTGESEIVAGNEESLAVQVQLLDEDGQPSAESGVEVVLEADSEEVEIVNSVSETINGVANFEVRAGTKALAVNLVARVSGDASYPVGSKLINVVADRPTNLTVDSDSFVLVANGQAKTNVKIELRDRFGNLANNDFSKVAIFNNALVDLRAEDLDPNFIGTQVSTLEGTANVDLQAKEEVGTGILIAVLVDYELEQEILAADGDISEIDFESKVGARISLDIVEKLDLEVNVLDREFNEAESVLADGESVIRLQPNLLYQGEVVEKYSGPIEFKVLTPELGGFVGAPPVKMVNGQLAAGNILLQVGDIAGEMQIEVNVPGIVRKVVKVELVAGTAVSLDNQFSKESLSSRDDEAILQVRLVDEFGNLANGSNGQRVMFKATGSSSGLVEIENEEAVVSDGVATANVRSRGKSGQANIVIEVEGLGSSLASINLKKELDLQEIAELAPRSLYTSLLGSDFANGDVAMNAAQAILFGGKGQVVSAPSASGESKKLLSVDSAGEVTLLEESLESTVAAASSEFPYQSVTFSDPVEGRELARMFIVPKPELTLKLAGEGGEGIFVEQLAEDLELVRSEGALHLVSEGERVVSVDNFGRLKTADNSYQIGLAAGESGFVVKRAGRDLLRVFVRQDLENPIRTLPKNSQLNNFFPGVYLQSLTEEKRFAFGVGLSGNSTASGKAVELLDLENELSANQKPAVSESFGYGFEGENKHMLLFAAGNSVGEANLADMSEATLIYGDPLVRLDNRTDFVSALSGFTKDLGKPILDSKKTIKEMVNLDFNGDAEEDALVFYEDGSARLLENTISNDKFTDRGEVLKVFGEITSTAVVDLNNDGFDDLVVGTTESCHNNEECISVYENIGSGFERKVVNLDLEGQRVYQMEGRDLNNDGCSDLTVSDSAGRVYSFYNLIEEGQCGGLETQPAKRFDFGYRVSDEENLAENIFVNYPGMAEVDGGVLQFQRVNFVQLPADNRLGDSRKVMRDLNGGSLFVGDEVEVVITLVNDGGAINGLTLSDSMSGALSVVEESLECVSGGCGEMKFTDSGVAGRERFISGVNVGEETVLKYKVLIEALPQVSFVIGNSFRDYPVNDEDSYLDLLLKTPEGPVYLYSTGLDSEGRVIHRSFVPEEDPVRVGARGNDLLEASSENPGEVTEELAEEIARLRSEQTADRNYDGLPDSFGGKGDNESLATKIANKLEQAISTFRCSGGGCFPTPYNKAFLVPDGPTPGIAALAFLSEPPFIATAYPSTAPSEARVYISPTLSGGLGTAACFGQAIGHSSPCFAYAIPPAITGIAAVCEELLAPLERVVEEAKEVIVDAQSDLTLVLSDAGLVATPEMIEEAKKYDDSFNLSEELTDVNDPVSVNAKVNVRIPGFPSFFTDWVDNQIDEIYNKLLDFPKFYLVLPDLEEFVLGNGQAISDVSFKNLNDFARSIAAIPLVQIESKEILVRVPALSQQELDKYKSQWKRWQESMKKQLRDRLAVWDCDENPEKRSVCDQIVVDMNKLINSVNEMIDALDALANFPRDLLNYRNLEAKYALQIVCYLQAVTNYTGGYIQKQSLIVQQWMRAIQDAIRTFKDWRVILDVMVEYQQSCDRCMNDRFSKLALLLEFFAVIPDLPVVPLPKWPDLVVDLSKIKTGVTILWPDVKFKPEAIVLPNLPDIILPQVLPSVRIEIPGFDVPDFPKLQLPDLPDLPPLPLPSLPDLPLPPRIPPLPKFIGDFVADLRPILRILCLLKTGLIPVPESALATEIETLTQPSVQAALPLLLQLGVQWPGIEYDFVKEVRVEAKSRFDVSTEYIYNQVKDGMEWWNKGVHTLINGDPASGKKGLNFYTQFDYSTKINKAIQEKTDEVMDEVFEGVEDGAIPLPGEGNEIPVEFNRPGAVLFEEFERELADYVASLPEEIEEHRLVASERYLDPNGVELGRSLAEVEALIAASDLPNDPLVNELAAMRDRAFAYATDLAEGNRLLEEQVDFEGFATMLAGLDSEVPRFAANDFNDLRAASSVTAVSLFGDGVEGLIKDSALNNDSRLLAAEIGVGAADVLEAANEVATSASQPPGVYVGLPNGMSENILNYTAEIPGQSHVLFGDFDGDSDSDALISMGGDIYLKENYENRDERMEREGEVIESETEISDHLDGAVVQNVRIDNSANRLIEVSFDAVSGAVAYEVILRRDLNERGRDGVQEFMFEASEFGEEARPRVSLEVENLEYYVSVVAVFENGERGDEGVRLAANPSICFDEDPPMPSLGATNFAVPVFSSLTLDASDSFDAGGRVVGYWLERLAFEAEAGKVVTALPREFFSDSNPTIDTDFDGIMMNDRSNPLFVIGPFENEGDIGTHEFVLHVIDEAGNSSEQLITVEVFAPEISLDPSFKETKVATGAVDPVVSGLPFGLMRERDVYRLVDGELVMVPHTEQVRNGVTDGFGRYEIKDFTQEEIIEVKDPDGAVIAEINARTGNVGAVAEGYEVIFEAATLPEEGSKVVIVDALEREMASVEIVLDSNSDVVVNEALAANQGAVNAFDVNREDNFIWKRIASDDSVNPGGAMLVREDMERVILIVDSGGNVVLLAPRVEVRVKDNDHLNQALVLQVVLAGEVIAEILLRPEGTAVFSSSEQVPAGNARLVSPVGFYGGRFDGSGGLSALSAAVDLFGEEEFITRGDFAFALLELMCIVPRKPEAYSANSGYNDVFFDPNNLARNYPYIKEATFLGLIEGYLGEEDNNGMVPFKPNATVNRAEALTMILRALEMKGVVNLDDIERGDEEAWYNGYVALAEDMGLIDGSEGNDPNEAMTYGELLAMVRQVLLVYSCEEVDSDTDGMSDFCEAKYGVDDANGDADGDLISNRDECAAGMDPTVPADSDTDGDGLLDRMELLIYLTDPEDSESVMEPQELRGGEGGIFVVPGECNTCPCLSTLENKADIIAGDKFFPVILKEYLEPERRIHIFKKGNEVSF